MIPFLALEELIIIAFELRNVRLNLLPSALRRSVRSRVTFRKPVSSPLSLCSAVMVTLPRRVFRYCGLSILYELLNRAVSAGLIQQTLRKEIGAVCFRIKDLVAIRN